MSYLHRVFRFLTHDIWRIPQWGQGKTRQFIIYLLKTLVLTIKRFVGMGILSKASALTYASLLSFIPLLALFFAIAQGLGAKKELQSELISLFPAQGETLHLVFGFIETYLSTLNQGVFFGLGIVFLLITVYNLISNIESRFNEVCDVRRGRSLKRKITEYFSITLIAPILIICSSGISLFLVALGDSFSIQAVGLFYHKILSTIPFLLTCLVFVALFVMIPNTKIEVRHTLIPGLLTGIVFTLFQDVYLSGQIWVSKYNAVYGSFAALPLFLLWTQFSWAIILFGATMSYAAQSIRSYDFEHDIRSVSHRYCRFLSAVIMAAVCQAFESGQKGCSLEDLTQRFRIPYRLAKLMLEELESCGLLICYEELPADPLYMPAVDISRLTMSSLLQRLDRAGSEDFMIDTKRQLRSPWELFLRMERQVELSPENVLVKDLKLAE